MFSVVIVVITVSVIHCWMQMQVVRNAVAVADVTVASRQFHREKPTPSRHARCLCNVLRADTL